MPRALDLCFRAGEASGKGANSKAVFDMLNAIAADLGAGKRSGRETCQREKIDDAFV